MPLAEPTQVYVSSGGVSGLEFTTLHGASSTIVSADFSFSNLVPFEFGGKTFLCVDLAVCSPLL